MGDEPTGRDGYIEITPRGISRSTHYRLYQIKNVRTYLSQAVYLAKWSLTERTFGRTLGTLWLVLEPIFQSIVLFLILSFVFNIRGTDVSFLSIYLSIALWRPTLNLVTGASTLLTSRSTILQQTNFPVVLILLEAACVELAIFSINLLIALALVVGSGRIPTLLWLLFPLVLIVQILFTMAVTIAVMGVGTLVRDTSSLVATGMTVVFYGSPILYGMDRIPEPWRSLLFFINPLTHIIPAYRAIFIDNSMFPLWPIITIGALSIVAIILELRILETARHRFYQFL